MQLPCPSCRTVLEMASIVPGATYQCPICHRPFAIPGPPAAPTVSAPRPAPPQRKVRPASQPRGSSGRVLAGLVYAAVLVATGYVVVSKLNRLKPAGEVSGGGSGKMTLDQVLTAMDTSTKQIDTAERRVKEKEVAQAQQVAEVERDVAIEALRAGLSKAQANQALMTAAYTEIWFDGDGAAGAGMVQALMDAYEDGLAYFEDPTKGTKWHPTSGKHPEIGRLWPYMVKTPAIKQWLEARELSTTEEFKWYLAVAAGRGDGSKIVGEQLPADVQALEPTGTGTGFWISENGYLLTNEHVVRGDNPSIHVRTEEDRRLIKAEIVFVEKKHDLALLRTTGVATPHWLALAPSQAEQGADVFTIGFPQASILGTNSKLEHGKITATSGIHDNEDHYQISVALLPGNSGGALVQELGGNPYVVGVVSSGLPNMGRVFYAIKSGVVRDFLARSGQAAAIGLKNAPSAEGSGDNAVVQVRRASCMVIVRSR
ncbi:MAG: trypsin-like peptidase domain-containing protein [Verrucomicrobiales bacterium]